MSFYSIAGTQLHWRNAAFVSGEPSRDFVDRLFKSPGWKFVVVLFSSLMVYEIVLFIILPPEPTFIFMSWAVLALPVIDVHASSALGVLHPIFGAGYVDRWMNKILGILDEQRVANETLVVAVRDHGLSIAENHGVTAYLNPNMANFHVPLVLSHPQLPTLHSNAAVQSLQILPTILDLLLETRSLPDEAFQAAADLLGLYEGQSLIGPIHTESRKTGQPNWQFIVMNSGKATLGVRSARDPAWRLVVPLVEDMEWRFTNLEDSPNETEEIVDFGYTSFLGTIEEIHGKGAAVWAEEAAFLARWWVDENRRRYRYTE
ncbi:hypothetical protein NHJ6243_006081 [Beauveria neobassiana]